MATLSITQTLSCADCSTDVLSISNTDSLTVASPMINAARVSIATGSASYIYVKVISGTNASDWVQVKLDGHAQIKMRVGEFLFLPIYNAIPVTAEAQGGACIVEYGQWSV